MRVQVPLACRVGREIWAAIPGTFISICCSGNGACKCQHLGSFSTSRRSHCPYRNSTSTRDWDGQGFLWLSRLVTVMCQCCSVQLKKLNLSVWNTSKSWGRNRSVCFYHFVIGILCNGPVKKWWRMGTLGCLCVLFCFGVFLFVVCLGFCFVFVSLFVLVFFLM